MNRLPILFYWLTAAALVDWFVLRTITRVAVHIPKSPAVVAVYEGISVIGQVAASLTVLLVLAALGWIAWRAWRAERAIWLPLAMCGLAALSLVFLVIAPSSWLAAGQLLLSLLAVGLIVGRMGSSRRDADEKLLPRYGIAIPAMAFVMGLLYQLAPVLYEALRLPGPPPITGLFFHLGELLVVASPVALWLVRGRGASRQTWLLAAIPALLFTTAYLRDPAMTGILAIWSTGLSLYLPWPAYVVSLWLAGVVVIGTLRRGNPAGLAILLLLAGGYVPQLSTQLFLGLIALWLLAEPTSVARVNHAAHTSLASLTRAGRPEPTLLSGTD